MAGVLFSASFAFLSGPSFVFVAREEGVHQNRRHSGHHAIFRLLDLAFLANNVIANKT